MKLKTMGKKVKAFLSALFGRRKESRGQLTGGESDRASSVSLHIVVQGEPSKASETRPSTAGVRNPSSGVFNDDTQSATNSALRSDYSNITGNEYEVPDVNANESRGIFNHAHHLILMNPTMVDRYTHIVNQVVGDREAKAKELLLKHIIPGAAHDSSARDPPPQCHPGTRITINERIMTWFYDEKKRELILWINGPAGVGKSAIVQTIAEALALAQCLGASVFFSRPNGRDSSRSVFITIAYQLAVHIGAYCAFISEKLASDPELVNKGMKEQFKTFIVEPFVEKKIGADGKTWGILLDGLDELDEHRSQREIIRLITTFSLEHPEVPLVWVISSRPEPHISNTFRAKQTISSYWEEYVPVDSPEACQDVERYLRNSFETIRQDSPPHIVPEDWPDDIKITTLAHAASGLFAFANVAVRFIEDPKHADPVTRLDNVLSVIDGSIVSSADDQPFAHLDALYTCILASIPSKMWPITRRVLGAILWLPSKLVCAKGLSVPFGLELSKIYTSINELYSILNIPLDDIYSQSWSFHHASFVDFLCKVTRSKEFHVSIDDTMSDFIEYGVRIWLDFKRQSSQSPSSEYYARWSKYASQFHSDANVPVNVTSAFNYSMFDYIHLALLSSLQEKRDLIQEQALHGHWDQFLDLLCQVDAATACHGWIAQNHFVTFWFDIWKTYRDGLTKAGTICEIQLQQLQLNHLEWPKECPTHKIAIRSSSGPHVILKEHKQALSSCKAFHEYILGLKYFQRRDPTLQVLICGTPGRRFAVLIYKYKENDFKERSLHTKGLKNPKLDESEYHGYYCIPYPDNV